MSSVKGYKSRPLFEDVDRVMLACCRWLWVSNPTRGEDGTQEYHDYHDYSYDYTTTTTQEIYCLQLT